MPSNLSTTGHANNFGTKFFLDAALVYQKVIRLRTLTQSEDLQQSNNNMFLALLLAAKYLK